MTRKVYHLTPAQKARLDVIKTLAKKNLGRISITHTTDELTTIITATTGKHSKEVLHTMEPIPDDVIDIVKNTMRDYTLAPINVLSEKKGKNND